MTDLTIPTDGPIIAPSMLKCDYGNLQADIAKLPSEGWLHWDVMDGHFVPNLSYGAMVIAAARRVCEHRFDAHLMISDPATYAMQYVEAGCDLVTFHIEAEGDASDLCRRLNDAGAAAGITINPDTPVSAIEHLAGRVQNVLVMSVNPGFGGQSFISDVLTKCGQIRETFGPEVMLSIDGGIDPDTIGPASAAGVDFFVVGSAIFGQPDYRAAAASLHRIAADRRSA